MRGNLGTLEMFLTFQHEGQVPHNSHSFVSGASRTKFRAPSSPTRMLNAAKQNTKYSHPLLFAVVSSHDPAKSENPRIIDRPPPPQKNVFQF